MLQRFLNLVTPAPKRFSFRGYETDDCSGEVRFHYSFDNGLDFCELLQFDHPLPPRASPLRAELEAALDALNIAYGIRYYQGFTPREIVFDCLQPTIAQRAFFQDLYENGLGEFGYRNKVDIAETVNFFEAQGRQKPSISDVVSDDCSTKPKADGSVTLPRVSAVLVGGGKDSAVSVEVLRAAEEPMLLFSVNPTKPIRDCAHASGLPFMTVHYRRLYGRRGKKGHIPHSAIFSLTAIAAAFVYGFDTVVLSNERSAEEGNVVHRGREINHQYGKTAKFERSLQAYVAAHVTSKITYFSLLRPLSELHIARLLSKSDRYDGSFMSCNQGRKSGLWCRGCPKCQFSFLALATAMSPRRLRRIFGANLLDEEKQLRGYEELVGLSGHKPWECVGEIAESAVAMLSLAAQPAWKDTFIIKRLAPRLQPLIPSPSDVWEKFLTPSPVHHMPKRFEEMLYAYVETSDSSD
jgi:UDP-N-acetyl-alpha-D-muramoyl-L-alanyl-L-glutamate epimerase